MKTGRDPRSRPVCRSAGQARTALTRVLRAIIGPASVSGPMIARNTLVSAVRA
ncbi:hypothetical protein MAHJHV33_48190 [Mycobacterium avium subsp. hominissuis]